MDHCFVSAIWRFLCASMFLVGITVHCQAAEIYVAKFPFSELSLSICGELYQQHLIFRQLASTNYGGMCRVSVNTGLDYRTLISMR